MRWPSLAYSPARNFDSWSSSSTGDFNFGLLSCWATYLRKTLTRSSLSNATKAYPEFTVHDLKLMLEKYLHEFQLEYGSDTFELLIDAIISSLELQNTFYNKSQGRNLSVPPADDDVCIFLYSEPEIETSTTSDVDQVVQPPTGVFPSLSKCYSPTCDESNPCYSSSCPHNTRSTIGRASPPMGRRSSKCYSSNCEHGQGCYSPTCPNRYTDPLEDGVANKFPPSPSSASFSVPHSPSVSTFSSSSPPIYEPIIVISIIGTYITWIDQKCRPLEYMMQRPIPSYSPGADTPDISSWIGGSAEINVR